MKLVLLSITLLLTSIHQLHPEQPLSPPQQPPHPEQPLSPPQQPPHPEQSQSSPQQQLQSSSQQPPETLSQLNRQQVEQSRQQNELTVLFYNVENLFDCNDDSLKNDTEYLPGGIRGWNKTKFWKKIGNISKVISTSTNNGFPVLVGLAEVENAYCLDILTKAGPLKNAGYKYIHYESEDKRGIDVCLLYNPYIFRILNSKPIKVILPDQQKYQTRDILYVKGQMPGQNSIKTLLHIFVCHFPSRLGGELETEDKRIAAAESLKTVADSIQNSEKDALIIIMGDFNDTAQSPSIKILLKNNFHDLISEPTHKHQSEWSILDHIIISSPLLPLIKQSSVIKKDFLLIPDKRWLGIKPLRTYHGMKYEGGWSDHLPVFLNAEIMPDEKP